MKVNQELLLEWLIWWHHGFWLLADDSWKNELFLAIPAKQQKLFLHQHAGVWRRHLKISDEFIGVPHPLVRSLVQLPLPVRTQLIMMLAEITGCVTSLPSDLKIWCRRLSKGLRPETWVSKSLYSDGQYANSLVFIQALWPTLWPRLKFMFPQFLVANSAEIFEHLVREGKSPFLKLNTQQKYSDQDKTNNTIQLTALLENRVQAMLEAAIVKCLHKT